MRRLRQRLRLRRLLLLLSPWSRRGHRSFLLCCLFCTHSHTSTFTCTHTFARIHTQLAHTPIHTHTPQIYRQSAVFVSYFVILFSISHEYLLIFSYNLWSRFTVSALQFSKFSEICIQCTHFYFICFAAAAQWQQRPRRRRSRRRPAAFWALSKLFYMQLFFCFTVAAFVFLFIRVFALSSAAWLQLDCIVN